jgi:NAD(P)H dehydrogenase (quinone)
MSNILIVHAHPEPASLTSALKDIAVEKLRADGHAVQVSDLYAMKWKPLADAHDFTAPRDPDRLIYIAESKNAYAGGTQSEDITAEQDKLLWADAVLFSFPLWWYGMPAILKGWFDRVFAFGFAYGVGEHNAQRWGDRYGEGTLAGRRAMLIVPIGGHLPHYSDRGVNGSIHDVLWPIQHGALFYPGMDVMPPFPVFRSDRMDDEGWAEIKAAFRDRLAGLFSDDPIPYRTQNGGHYDGKQRLKPELGGGSDGINMHLVRDGDPEEVLRGQVRKVRAMA